MTGANGAIPNPAPSSSARLVALVALADEVPTAAELAGYLADGDAGVRRAAVAVLTESAPDDAGVALAGLLDDPDAAVRRAAVDALDELREVLVAGGELRQALSAHLGSPHAAVRAAVVRLLYQHRLGARDLYVRSLSDPDPRVRREAVGGLVSLDATAEMVAAAGDLDPLIRLAVARGAGVVAGGSVAAPAAIGLAADPDVRVAAAALESLARLGCPGAAVPVVLGAVGAEPWELRRGAALALAAAAAHHAIEPLLRLVTDANLDVRKAAVQGLASWVGEERIREALVAATADPDADVRGYARLALS